MSALDASGEVLAAAQSARTAQATQVAAIAARLERLPLTSYQKGIFAIIATAWFFDSMDLGGASCAAPSRASRHPLSNDSH
jgi:putative MFS transporter